MGEPTTPTDSNPKDLNLDYLSQSGVTYASQLVAGSLTLTDPVNGPYVPNLPGASSVPTPPSVTSGKVWDWGGAVYNTKAGNALVDGATDDASALNTEITNLPAASGTLLQPSGTSLIGARIGNVNKSNYALQGSGRDSAIIQLKNSANDHLFGYLTGGLTGITIADLTFDGNKANQTTGNGLEMVTYAKSVIRNVRVKNVWGRGVYLYNCTDMLVESSDIENNGASATTDGSGASIMATGTRLRVIGNRIDSGNDIGIGLTIAGVATIDAAVHGNIVHSAYLGIAGGAATGFTQQYMTAVGNIAANCGTTSGDGMDFGKFFDSVMVGNIVHDSVGGFSCDTGGRASWIGNISRGATGSAVSTGWGISPSANQTDQTSWLSSDGYCVIANQLTNNWQDGLSADGIRGDMIVIGNYIKSNGQGSVGTTNNGIDLSSSGTFPASANSLIIGNKIYDDQNVKTQNYGVNIRANVYATNLIHNDLRGNKTGAINDGGVATYTHGNLGYNPRGFLSAPSPAASGTILYNPFNCDCMVYINGSGGAALTAVAVGGVAAPTNATHAALSTGGTLATGTYWYRISALNPNGETLASTETSIAVTGPTGSVLVRWNAVPGATGYNVYGRTTGAELKLVGNVQTNTWWDTGAITPSGALPGGDTTGNTALTGFTAAPAADSVIGIYLPWGNGIKVTYTTFVAANWQWFGL